MGGQRGGLEDKTLEEVIKNAIDSRLMEVHISLPASVETFDRVKGSCTVRPLIKRQLIDGSDFELPVIVDVPVCWQTSGDFQVTFPLTKGDTGMLIFSERSLDTWKVSGGCQNPKDFRKHDLTDAQFSPGLRPFSDPPEVLDGKLLVKAKDSRMTLSTDGKVALGKLGTELLQQIEDFIALVEVHIHPTVMGPTGVPTNAAAMTAIKDKITSIKGSLT